MTNHIPERYPSDTEMRDAISKYFPNEANNLAELCHRDETGFLGDFHIDVFAELSDFDENSSIVARLKIAYILISNLYFLLDATVDGHLRHPSDVLYTPHLVFLTLTFIYEIADEMDLTKEQKRELSRIISQKMSANAKAVKNEMMYRSQDVNSHDYQSIVGRSNSTILFYEIMSYLQKQEPNIQVKQILNDIVYYMQLGDDLGDWKKDLAEGNYTPLLQECFKRIPNAKKHELSLVEQELYINGVYEEYVSQIINGFDRLYTQTTSLKGISVTKLCAYIEKKRKDAYGLLEEMLKTKVVFLQNTSN